MLWSLKLFLVSIFLTVMKSLINTEGWSREVVVVDDPDVVQQSFGTHARGVLEFCKEDINGGMLVGPQKTRMLWTFLRRFGV